MLQHGAPVRVISASAPKNTSQLATLHLSLAASAVAAGWTDVVGRAGNVSRHLVLEKGKVTRDTGHHTGDGAENQLLQTVFITSKHYISNSGIDTYGLKLY